MGSEKRISFRLIKRINEHTIKVDNDKEKRPVPRGFTIHGITIKNDIEMPIQNTNISEIGLLQKGLASNSKIPGRKNINMNIKKYYTLFYERWKHHGNKHDESKRDYNYNGCP